LRFWNSLRKGRANRRKRIYFAFSGVFRRELSEFTTSAVRSADDSAVVITQRIEQRYARIEIERRPLTVSATFSLCIDADSNRGPKRNLRRLTDGVGRRSARRGAQVKRSTPIELDGEDLRRSPSEYALMPSGLEAF
jgi:hypothetical protein